jgi:hypothetical protein
MCISRYLGGLVLLDMATLEAHAMGDRGPDQRAFARQRGTPQEHSTRPGVTETNNAGVCVSIVSIVSTYLA